MTLDFEKHFKDLKERASQKSASVALGALRQKLEEFEEQNERDLKQALEEHELIEKAFQGLIKEIDTKPTQVLLFSLLKTKKIADSAGANFQYEEKRSNVLDEPLDGKLRREQKALAKIDQLDEAKEIERILQTTLDLKDDFIIPIFYPFAPLAVYHSIESTSTLDIVEELTEKNLISEPSKSLLQQTIAAIYVMRVRLHFQFQASPWEGSHDEICRLPNRPNTLSEDEQKVLDRAYWMVQRPLHEYLHLFKKGDPLAKTMDLEALALDLFKKEVSSIDSQALLLHRYRSFIDSYARYLVDCLAPLEKHLDVYKFLSTSSFFEPLRKVYLDTLEEKKVVSRIIDVLVVIPNRDGYRQSYRIANQKLLARIAEFSVPEDQGSSYEGVEVILDIPELGKRKLKSDWIPNLVDLATGRLNPNPPKTNQPEYRDCRHRVRSIPGFGLHMKELPDHPAMEYAVGNLMHRLFQIGPPATQLARVTVSGKGSYPVLFSETVLGKVFDPENDWVDPAQLTELLISQVLLLPGDANARNFIFSKPMLRCIDNDVSFVDPVVRSGVFRTIQLTSILFCLKQPLILDQRVIEKFCNLDPLFILNGWLEDVIQREKSYAALFPEVSERRLFLEKNPEESFTPFFSDRTWFNCSPI